MQHVSTWTSNELGQNPNIDDLVGGNEHIVRLSEINPDALHDST